MSETLVAAWARGAMLREETGASFSCHMREAPMTLSVATTSVRRAAGAVEVIPTGAALGAEVRGVDLTHLDEAGFAASYRPGTTIRWCCSAVSRSATRT